MKKIVLEGALTAIVTPFTKSGKVDLPALRRLIAYQLEGGVHGIVACGTTGEASTLTEAEYSQVVRCAVRSAGGKVPVIAGAGSNNTERAIAWSRLAAAAGADGLLHVSPFYNKPTPNGLVAHYKAIAKATNLPIILYNVPGRTGSNVLPATVLRIAREVPQVIALKEAGGSMDQFSKLLHGAPSGFTVLSGEDSLALPAMVIGAKGCISVVANEAPRDFAALCTAALSGDWTRARELHFRLLDLMNINFIESNPIPVKTALGMMGLIEDTVRLPLAPLETHNRPAIKKCLMSLKLIPYGKN